MRILPFLVLLILTGCRKEVIKPSVTTAEADQITASSALVGGEVTSAGSADLTSEGIYWGSEPDPVADGTRLIIVGFGMGAFSTILLGLTEQTTYYYQAFASNEHGTSYGEVVSFTTLPGGGTFMDPRDQHGYRWIKIGTQTWMAENLAYLPAVNPPSEESYDAPFYYVYDFGGSSASEAKSTGNYTSYGVLYNWYASTSACPAGWHLPSDLEFKILETFLGMSGSDADVDGYRGSGSIGKALKSTSGWNDNLNGDNSTGFSAVPGGGRYGNGSFGNLGTDALFWTSSEGGDLFAWYRNLSSSNQGVFRLRDYRKLGFSIRCLKDE